MSRVNDVHAGIWGEDDFLDLSSQAKLLYVWSFTNPLCGMSGVYKVSLRVIAFQTGVEGDELDRALGELQLGRFVVHADGALFVRTRVKHLRTKSEQIAKSIATDVRRLSVDHPVREAFFAEYGEDQDWGEGKLFTQLHGDSLEPPRGSPEPHGGSESLHGKGKGYGKEEASVVAETTDDGRARTSKSEPDGFADWLSYHAERSGRRVPREKTAERKKHAATFAVLVAEGHTLDDFKLATDGVIADEWKRANGHDKFETVLRKTKFGEMVEDGRRAREPRLAAVPAGRVDWLKRGEQWAAEDGAA